MIRYSIQISLQDVHEEKCRVSFTTGLSKSNITTITSNKLIHQWIPSFLRTPHHASILWSNVLFPYIKRLTPCSYRIIWMELKRGCKQLTLLFSVPLSTRKTLETNFYMMNTIKIKFDNNSRTVIGKCCLILTTYFVYCITV